MSTNTFDGTYKNDDGSIKYVKGKKVTTIDYGQSSTIEYTDEDLKKHFGNRKKINETDMPKMALQSKESADEEIVLGDTSFKVVESPERMIIFDKKTGEGCVLLGGFDKSAIKKDLTEVFKDWHGDWDITTNDIHRFISKEQEKGNDAYINIDQDVATDLELEAHYKEQQQELEPFSKEGLENAINQTEKGIWYKNDDKQNSLEPDETLRYTFGDTTVKFGIWETRDCITRLPETEIKFWRESDGLSSIVFGVKGNADTAQHLVANIIKDSFQKNISFYDIGTHLSSQIIELHQEAEIKNPQNSTVQLAKKAGYVQGVCECVAAIGDDHVLGKKLLSEMNVTKDMAKKYASPETYKALEQGIFAPRQEQEQSLLRGSRGM
jgi:hypothetical protein